MRAIMAATFLGLRNSLSLLPLFVYFLCFPVTNFHPNDFCALDNQLTRTKRYFACFNGLCLIPHRRIATWNKHGCTCLLLPSRDLTICMDIESNPGPPHSLLNADLSAVVFDSMSARHSYSTTSIGLVNVFARKVYTREELFSIRAQCHRWSNNSFYYRLKSLGIFKYRGKRSGFSSKLRLRTNNQAIPAICSRRRSEDACASYNIRQTSCSVRLARKSNLNLITIESQAMAPKISTAKAAASLQFVPSLFLSNVMFLAPKIDEVNSVVIYANVDVVCITETWLQSHIPDSVVAINGYNLIRRDRRDVIHGGVCMYIKASIPFTILEDLEDESCSFEVLWIKLRPFRLPRGISSIIAGVVYHPPKATNSMMLDYLTKCLMDLESKYPKCGLLVLGDFNHLNDARLKSNFNLKQIVHFPTRGQNTLDKILTNLQDYYDTPVERPAFGLSDHSSVEAQPKPRVKTSQTIQKVTSRDLRPSNRLAMRTYLYEVDVTAMIAAMTTCEDKVSMLQTIIKTGLDLVLPMKPKIIHRTEPPWINSTLKNLIRKRQVALGRGDRAEFNHLRNLVNRERKRCRAKYYECKVQHLKACSPAKWWSEIKRLSGMEGPIGSRDNVLKSVHHLEGARGISADDLANHINTAFLAPMEVFEPLTHNPYRGDAFESSSRTMNDDFSSLSEFSIFRKLCSINPVKAQGPDGIPGWLLKENADLLAPPITDIINTCFREGRLPLSWKEADIVPVPKQRPIQDINKHLRPISLTPILSKIAEDYVVHDFVIPAVLKKIDKRQYGTIPKSCTTHALVSMIHNWHVCSDGNSAVIRVVLFDFRKAFDLIDHNILVRKLLDYDIPNHILCWITDFYRTGDRELNWPRTASPNGVTFQPVFHRGQSLGRGYS